MGPGGTTARNRHHLVPARRRCLHRLYLHRRPALVFGAGAIGFFALPYTIIVYPLVFLILPRMWAVAHKHNYITAADFVQGRYGNRWLALAVAVTGIVATMPYIALQLLGLQVVIGAMGVGTGGGLAGDIPLIIAFVILAAFTYTSGLRAPAMIAVVKDTLIYITVLALVIVVPYQLGGYANLFAAIPPEKLLLPTPGPGTLGQYSAYATLALGSAFALFLYPHTMTARAQRVQRRAGHPPQRDAYLPAYSFLLGLLALSGFMALAAGVASLPEFAPQFEQYKSNSRSRRSFCILSRLVRGRGVRRNRHRRPCARRHHVDRGLKPVHPQHLCPLRPSGLHTRAGNAERQAGLAGGQSGCARLHYLPAIAICDPAAAAWRHLDQPDDPDGDLRALHALVQSMGALDRLGAGLAVGTWMAGTTGFQSAVFPLQLDGLTVPGYAALYALASNVILSIVLSPIFNRSAQPRAATKRSRPTIASAELEAARAASSAVVSRHRTRSRPSRLRRARAAWA